MTGDLATWGERGQLAVYITALIGLIITIARIAQRRVNTALGQDEDEIEEQNAFAPQHSGGHLPSRPVVHRRD